MILENKKGEWKVTDYTDRKYKYSKDPFFAKEASKERILKELDKVADDKYSNDMDYLNLSTERNKLSIRIGELESRLKKAEATNQFLYAALGVQIK